MENVTSTEITELINRLYGKLQTLKLDKKVVVEKLESAFDGDTQWEKHQDDLRLARDAKKYRELEIIESQKLQEFADKKKDLAMEIKETSIMLNDYLGSYAKLSGSDVCDINGKKLTIITKYSFKAQQLRMFN